MTRTWITARLEEDDLTVTAHAAHGFGTREATVHLPVTGGLSTLEEALRGALNRVTDDLTERAEEAAYEHRIRYRLEGRDFNAPIEMVDGAGLSGNVSAGRSQTNGH